MKLFLPLLLLITSSTYCMAQKPALLKLNPPSLYAPKTYSQVVTVAGGTSLVVLSGQVAQDRTGKVLAPGDLKSQIGLVLNNVQEALYAVGANWYDVVKVTYYVVDYKPEDLEIIRSQRAKYIPQDYPPASTLVGVSALFDPGARIEIEVLAVLPNQR